MASPSPTAQGATSVSDSAVQGVRVGNLLVERGEKKGRYLFTWKGRVYGLMFDCVYNDWRNCTGLLFVGSVLVAVRVELDTQLRWCYAKELPGVYGSPEDFEALLRFIQEDFPHVKRTVI